jgi:exodeoxyribonuclease VII large subunit
VISSVGHHTDRTLIDDVAAVCCSTPTHAAEAAVRIDCRAARSDVAAYARRLEGHGRRAILDRARALSHLSRAPGQHVARHRSHLHQMLRELRATGRRACASGRERAGVHLLVLGRTAARAQASDAFKQKRDLERLALALGAHDPDRTLARGYAIVRDGEGEPVGSARAARATGHVELQFHDGRVGAEVDAES